MSKELNYFLQKLKFSNRSAQRVIFQNIALLLKNASRNDLLCLLDIINTSDEVDLQVQIFSVLRTYLLTNDAHIAVFIKCNYMYNSIDKILAKNLTCKIIVVLNFLTLLLHDDCEDFTSRKTSLVMYAKNMIKTSGCLCTMADIFTHGIMYQETWDALCLCLAESCNNCECNQSYCTHLIPKCVQRWRLGNMEVLPLLQSLLRNHRRNIQMFIQSNGMRLFTRNLLQYSQCLRLLDTVIQTSEEAAVIAKRNNTFKYVHEILKTHGPYSQIGQWATVILYHADSIIKEAITNSKQIDANIGTTNIKEQFKNGSQIEHISQSDNTTQLFHNVIKEIIQWQPNRDVTRQELGTFQNLQGMYEKRDNPKKYQKETFEKFSEFQQSINVTDLHFQPKIKRQKKQDYELSFIHIQESKKKLNSGNGNIYFDAMDVESSIATNNSTCNLNHNMDVDVATTEQIINSHLKNVQHNLSVENIQYFQPFVTSTPKKKAPDTGENTSVHDFSIQVTKNHRTKKLNCNPKQNKQVLKKDLNSKSFSSRIFSAINESCITFVNTVKNMFRGNTDSTRNETSISNLNQCVKQDYVSNYSFTKYMRKRDAILANNISKNVSRTPKDHSISNLCRTCDNTFTLKQKLANNKQLKRTVQKLKLGINLYGCDFKKISKTMWPRDSYMTAEVLYNLYRKLIVK